MPNLHLLDFGVRNDYFGGYRTFVNEQGKFVRHDARDPLAGMQAARRANLDNHIFFRVAWHNPEETGQLRLKKAPVERSLASLINRRRRKSRGTARSRRCRGRGRSRGSRWRWGHRLSRGLFGFDQFLFALDLLAGDFQRRGNRS